jgi:squalene-hopene/tetraprenyl-beta-curcumene cyclase
MLPNLQQTIHALAERLLGELRAEGHWEGELSSSALSTATAVSALSLVGVDGESRRITAGAGWLATHQNSDGGWGDTIDSPSNLATTLLAVSALRLAAVAESPQAAATLEKARCFLDSRGGTTPEALAAAIQQEYGEDRTFAVPILMNCALAGTVTWDHIPGLPFELAVFPHRWYRVLRLQVVSYALPALIAIGLLVDRKNPPHNHLKRLLRRAVTPQVLKKLRQIQPENGGFLEATPLTSFVAMGLIPVCGREHPVAARCLDFLRKSQRGDGSWPIDTNLSVWLTTASVAALTSAGQLHRINGQRTAQWLAARQLQVIHPYTQAAPGGWAWTHLPGGVVDADDTSGAILALTALEHRESIPAGVRWLLDVQNADGGWPTFCRGWGKLPFDKSSPDLTAHALRAIGSVDPALFSKRRGKAVARGLNYLRRAAGPDGSWIPLWFGNQRAPGSTNPVLGTARVLRALERLDPQGVAAIRGVEYLLRAQNTDGGWGGSADIASSLEETALVVTALAAWAPGQVSAKAFLRGVEYLLQALADSTRGPVPIGLYFSHLWYSEKLYPLIWSLDALGRAAKVCLF